MNFKMPHIVVVPQRKKDPMIWCGIKAHYEEKSHSVRVATIAVIKFHIHSSRRAPHSGNPSKTC
jgi:hypothetical protein